eukprot:jgi/Orpsp1_1/1178813/evm.model.c7180000066839.1
MSESISDNDLLSYINEELITNNSEKEELNEELYSKYLKTDGIGKNSTINLNEKNKLDLAQATLLNSLTNNVYNQTLPLSPPQDDINSPSSEIYLNSQNVQNVPSNSLNSPSMELEALSPSSIGSEVNDISVKSEEQNLMNLTQIYQNNGLIADSLINQGLLSQYTTNSDLINNNVLLNAMCTDENNKSQLFPQVLPNTNISIPSTYINDTLNSLSTVNISLPNDTNIPVTLNTVMSLPTLTVPSNMEFTVPSNALNLNSDLATTAADLDLTTLQSLSPLAMSGPLAVANSNPTPINPTTIINSLSNTAPSTGDVTETKAISSNTITNGTLASAITSSAATAVPTVSNSSLSSTLDLTSLKSSVNETLQLTKKLSQGNNTTNINEKGKSNIIDVTDILKSDVAASCLNLLKGSKGKPGRKKKCLQNSSSDSNNITLTSTSTSSNTSTNSTTSTIDNKFPYLKLMNQNTESTGNTNVNNLQTNSVKFPVIKPKINTSSTSDNHTPILPLAPSTTKSNSINCFNGSLISKAPSPGTKPLNSTILHPPILPNGSTEKNNSNNNNQVKTAYQKRQERLLKNREAAHLSRKRKREQLHMLETHAQELIAENQTLKLKVIELEQLNEKLLKENELLKMNINKNTSDINLKMNVKKESSDIHEMTDVSDINTNAMSSDIYNLYIKSEALNGSNNTSTTQNKTSTKSKEIGIVFMVILFSFSLFTFPLSIFSGKNNNEISNSLISSFMNKLSDFSLASISSDNTGKILSSGYEKDKPFLLDGGHYELSNTEGSHGELEVRDMNRKRNGKGQLSQYKKSKKMKNTNSNSKSKQKRNTTRKNIKKNYEYTSFNEISSLMSVFHPKNVDLDEDVLKQMSILQNWIVEGFCSVHENHTFAKDSSNVKDIIKIYNDEDINESSTDLTVKKNGHNYYGSSKSKEIPWNMKQFIKFYPDTTYFYSPKLVQLFPLSSNDILEPSIPIINRLQPNDTSEAQEKNKWKIMTILLLNQKVKIMIMYIIFHLPTNQKWLLLPILNLMILMMNQTVI